MATTLRKATLRDVEAIYQLIKLESPQGKVLPRPLGELYETIRDFYILDDGAGAILGCCALHIVWQDLAEIRSLVVSGDHRGRNCGRMLVQACLDEARSLGIHKIFALTATPQFFLRLSFHLIDKRELPHKIWSDCARCIKFPECDELAVLIELDR